MTALNELTLTEMQSGLASGAFSSRELVRAALDHTRRLEQSLHAYLFLDEEIVLKQADQRDRQRRDNASAPLLGVPVAIKDVLSVQGMPCTCGSKILAGYTAPYTATSVQRLLDAGMVIMGKTNTDEFAMGSSTENSAYGVTHNPWDTARVPGGSSGGSAAAVAARFVPAALGTDTGGSVRQPAALCGVTGLKTTYGRVSRYGLVAFGSSLDTVGAFGRNARDVSTVFSAMAGHDNRDATSSPLALAKPDFIPNAGKTSLRGLRIGLPREFNIPGVQPEVSRAVQSAVDALVFMGAEVCEISLPHSEYALPVYYIIAPAEASANLARFDGVRYGARAESKDLWGMFNSTRGKGFGPEVTRRIMIGTYALSSGYYDAYYGQAQRVRTLIRKDFDAAFKQVDLIASPTSPITAFAIGEFVNDPLSMYLQDIFTLPANLAGVPGISFNCGFDSKGLPIGAQLIAPAFREDLLLRVTDAYQQSTEWHKRAPAL